jgi:hypothetical protein
MKRIFLLLLLLAILVRIIGLNSILYVDESMWALEMIDYKYSSTPKYIPHPPVSLWIYKFFTDIFGLQTWSLRLIPLLFGLLTICLTYLMAKENYNTKTALFSLFLISFSFWHILASLQVDMDGSILSFMYIAVFYFFIKHQKLNNLKYLILAGIFIGISLFVKLSALFILLIVSAYILFKNSDIEQKVYELLLIGPSSFTSIFILLAIIFIINQEMFLKALTHASGYLSFIPNMRPFIYLLIWGTPLLVGLTVLSLIKLTKKEFLFIFWLTIPLSIYMFSEPISAFGRYLMVIIPPMCILGGNFLSKIKFNKKQIFIFFIVFLIFYIALFIFNVKSVNYTPHNIDEYISMAINFKWGFFFPITGPSGPTFGLSFYSIAISLISSFVFLILNIIYFRKQIFKLFLVIFLAISFSFNVFLVQEFLFSMTQPNISKVTYEIIDYYKKHNLPEHIYTNIKSLHFYLNKTKSIKYFYPADTEIGVFNESITAKPSTILIVDFPKIPKKTRLWQIINNCKKMKIVYSKNIPTGYVFVCS